MASSNPTSATASSALPTLSTTPAPDVPSGDAFTDSFQADASSEHSPHHAALISGLAVGIAVFLALLGTLLWVERHRIAMWCSCSRKKQRGGMRSASYKLTSADNTPSSQGSEWEVRREARAVLLPAATATTAPVGAARSESQDWTRHDLRYSYSTTATTAPHERFRQGFDGGMAVTSGTGSANPTYLNDSANMARTRAGESDLERDRGTGRSTSGPEATPNEYAARAYLDRPLPASPSVSSMPVPITPATDTTTSQTSPPGEHTPYSVQTQQSQQRESAYTPSIYQPHPPTSLTQRHDRPYPRPSAPTYPCAHTPASHSTLASLPHIHSNSTPQRHLPGTASVLNAGNKPNHSPPSLPQPYSTVSLGSTASLYRRINSNLDLYRGLSMRKPAQATSSPEKPTTSLAFVSNAEQDLYRGLSSARNLPQKSGAVGVDGKEGDVDQERPPWDHLSAEEALGGGWRNSTGAVSGWETVREEDEEGE